MKPKLYIAAPYALALEGMAIEERRAELRRVVDDLFVRIGQFSKHWNIDENEQQK